MGQWSEIVCDALNELGHSTLLHYHNVKPLGYRFGCVVAPIKTLAGLKTENLACCSNRALLRKAANAKIDLLVSIQGKIDAETVAALRAQNPRLKIIYWFGDVLFPGVDRVLISYRGDCERLRNRLGEKITYFPFGYSPRYHSLGHLSKRDVRRYSSEVSFVGTWYPEREQILAPLVESQTMRLSVWGRSWRHAKSIRSRGRLAMSDTLKVHRLSKISLNIHHHLTHGGFNMKFYEIPAVGGFQICEWQEEIEISGFSDKVVCYKDSNELGQLINYYLKNEEKRQKISDICNRYVVENLSYLNNFQSIALFGLI
jgi:hypothetical protein